MISVEGDSKENIFDSKITSLLKLDREDVSIVDLSTEESDYPYPDLDSTGYLQDSELELYGDEIVPDTEIEKIRLLLRGREAIILDE